MPYRLDFRRVAEMFAEDGVGARLSGILRGFTTPIPISDVAYQGLSPDMRALFEQASEPVPNRLRGERVDFVWVDESARIENTGEHRIFTRERAQPLDIADWGQTSAPGPGAARSNVGDIEPEDL